MADLDWSTPLSGEWEHPLLRRGLLIHLVDGPWRIGSPLVLSDPVNAHGDPWRLLGESDG